MSVIGWPWPRRDEHVTVNYMDMSYLATLLAHGTRATSSTTRMSSQLYKPHYLVIRGEVPGNAPAQRRRAAILTGAARGRLLGAKIGASGQRAKLRRGYGRASVPGYRRITVVPAQAGLESMRYAPPAVSNW
jgi:hypothetical protein